MTAPQLTQYIQGKGSVTADGLNTFEQTTDIVNDLRSFIGVTGIQVTTRGRTTVNDGGAATYYWNAGGLGPDDGVNTIVPLGAATGVWSRIVNATGSSSITSLLVGPGTYTPLPGLRQLRIRMVGGGGGGGGGGAGGTSTNGFVGGDTSFNSVVAKGGQGGLGNGLGGNGGTGGAGGVAGLTFRSPGACGMCAIVSDAVGGSIAGPTGGAGPFGGGTTVQGGAGRPNSGAGGAGGIAGPGSNAQSGTGGGSGEYVEIIINAPLAVNYPFTVGNGGAGGPVGGGTVTAGFAGGSGIILVEAVF